MPLGRRIGEFSVQTTGHEILMRNLDMEERYNKKTYTTVNRDTFWKFPEGIAKG